jgi:hypothetical protein
MNNYNNSTSKQFNYVFISITVLFLMMLVNCVILFGIINMCDGMNMRISEIETLNGFAIDKDLTQ